MTLQCNSVFISICILFILFTHLNNSQCPGNKTKCPTTSPTSKPTITPTLFPSITSTHVPSVTPTITPTLFPTIAPTYIPTISPSMITTLSTTHTTNVESTTSYADTTISEITNTIQPQLTTPESTETVATKNTLKTLENTSTILDTTEIIPISPTDTIKIYMNNESVNGTQTNNVFSAVNISLFTVGFLSLCCIGFILRKLIERKRRKDKLRRTFGFDPSELNIPPVVTPREINEDIIPKESVSEFVMTVVDKLVVEITGTFRPTSPSNRGEGEQGIITGIDANTTIGNGVTVIEESDSDINGGIDGLYVPGNKNDRRTSGMAKVNDLNASDSDL